VCHTFDAKPIDVIDDSNLKPFQSPMFTRRSSCVSLSEMNVASVCEMN
jgi:hypothetical protein